MNQAVICPWCGKETTPHVRMMEKEHGLIRERRCAECGQVLAAYLAGEGSFMGQVRKYEN